jgi:D-alanyl-D-alanine carboxypeptidase/D-alanyl-D-alanine-endopeptidase (penicillin-binding protein 4)
MKPDFCFLFIFYFLLNVFQSAGQTQSPVLNRFLQSENFKHAAVSIKAVDLSTGKTVVSYNENMALTPASNMKIVTTATALDLLSHSFYFETPIFHDGIIRNGTLTGNLYIKGSGDPTLGSEFLEEEKEAFLIRWLSDMENAGIKNISGDIIVLDQLYGYEGISPKWLWEDIGNYYAPGIYGVSVFDNMYRAYVQSFAPETETVLLYTEPYMDNLQFTNEIKASYSTSDDSYVFGVPFSNQRRLYGSIPANRSSFAVRGDIPDPGLFLARYFYSYLQNHGIKISGKATTYRLEPKIPKTEIKIGSVRSPDLASIVRIINVKSNNHYAEHLYKLLTVSKNMDIAAYWKEKGLNSSPLFMFDGSGNSPQNAVSSGFLIDILIYMNKKSGKTGAFYKSLPVAGKEGTVTSFLSNTSLSGKAHLKSGSITNVQAYSGYIEKGNKRYAVSFLVNHFTGKREEVRKQMGKLLVDLF